jgi:hypothetical protein
LEKIHDDHNNGTLNFEYLDDKLTEPDMMGSETNAGIACIRHFGKNHGD